MKPVTVLRVCIATLAAAFAAGAAAQTLYKLIDKNGKITYSESEPKPGEFDGQVIRMDIDPNANRATLPKPAEGAFKSDANALPAREVLEARNKLAIAQRKLAEARNNPSESDMVRQGSVGGGARLVPSDAYTQRLANLEKDVKAAEEEVRSVEAKAARR